MDQNHDRVQELIRNINEMMTQAKEMKKLVSAENETHRTKILNDLGKSYEQNVHEVNFLKEELHEQINKINDLGHAFQELTHPIEVIASHSRIITGLKDCHDRLKILLAR